MRKKSEIVELDDAKDKVDVVKSGGHWKDHWVMQLITIRGEMHNTFSAPPKQGTPPNSFFLVFCFGFHFNFFIVFLATFLVSCPIVDGRAPRILANLFMCLQFGRLPPVCSVVRCALGISSQRCFLHWTPVAHVPTCWLPIVGLPRSLQ